MNKALDQADVIDIYRTLLPKSIEDRLCSVPHGTYSKIGHKIGSKTLFSKCKRTEIITNNLLDHRTVKLEIETKKLTRNHIIT